MRPFSPDLVAYQELNLNILSWMAFHLWYLRALIRINFSVLFFSVAVANQVVSKAKLLGLESGIMLLNFAYLVAKLKCETWNIYLLLKPQPSLKQCFEDRSASCEATRLPTLPRLSFCASVLALVMSAGRFHQLCRGFCVEQCQTTASGVAVSNAWCSELLPASWTDLLPLDDVLRMGSSWALCWLKSDMNHFLCLMNVHMTNFPPLINIPFCTHPSFKESRAWL